MGLYFHIQLFFKILPVLKTRQSPWKHLESKPLICSLASLFPSLSPWGCQNVTFTQLFYLICCRIVMKFRVFILELYFFPVSTMDQLFILCLIINRISSQLKPPNVLCFTCLVPLLTKMQQLVQLTFLTSKTFLWWD